MKMSNTSTKITLQYFSARASWVVCGRESRPQRLRPNNNNKYFFYKERDAYGLSKMVKEKTGLFSAMLKEKLEGSQTSVHVCVKLRVILNKTNVLLQLIICAVFRI